MSSPSTTILICLHVFCCLFSQGQSDSIGKVISVQKGEERNSSSVAYVRALVMESKNESAQDFGIPLLESREFMSDSSAVAKLMYYLSLSCNNSDSSIYWIARSYDYSHALEFSWRFYVRQEFMHLLEDRGDFKKSIVMGLENLEEATQAKDSVNMVKSLNNLGYGYDRMKDYHSAIEYYQRSLPIAEYMNDTILYGRTLGLIGIAYDELRDFDKAVEYNKMAIEKFRSSPSGREYLGTWLSNLGNTYTKLGAFDKAQKVLLESLEISESQGSSVGQAIVNINLGKLHLDYDDLAKAKEYLDKGMDLAQSQKLVRFQSEAHNYLARYFTMTANVQKAIFHLDRYHMLNDSLIDSDKNEQIANMQVKYETDKKIRENELLAQENEILELERDRQRFISYGTLAFLFLTLITGLLGYRVYRNRQKTKHNEQLVKEREKGLRVMLKSIEEERQRIAKDLHDGVGQQMTALKLQYNTLRTKLDSRHDQDLDEIAELLSETGKEIRSVSHQMMPRALTELGLVPAVGDMLRKSLDSTGITFHFETLGKTRQMDKQVEVGLYRIAQELTNNIIKHSKADHVDVQILFRPHSLIMTFEDNGIGMKEKKEEGVGLMNIMSRLNAISGEARYEEAQDHGTIAVIRIPLDQNGDAH